MQLSMAPAHSQQSPVTRRDSCPLSASETISPLHKAWRTIWSNVGWWVHCALIYPTVLCKYWCEMRGALKGNALYNTWGSYLGPPQMVTFLWLPCAADKDAKAILWIHSVLKEITRILQRCQQAVCIRNLWNRFLWSIEGKRVFSRNMPLKM